MHYSTMRYNIAGPSLPEGFVAVEGLDLDDTAVAKTHELGDVRRQSRSGTERPDIRRDHARPVQACRHDAVVELVERAHLVVLARQHAGARRRRREHRVAIAHPPLRHERAGTLDGAHIRMQEGAERVAVAPGLDGGIEGTEGFGCHGHLHKLDCTTSVVNAG